MQRFLHVFAYLPGALEAVPAGRFVHDDTAGAGHFAYRDDYLAREDALPVDPIGCPLEGAIAPTSLNGGLYGAFRDAAPDFWGRLVAAREQRRDPAELNELDLLLHGGASRVGHLDFRQREDDPEPTRALPLLADLAELVAAADAVQRGLPVDHAALQLLQQGTSMGGARPKCVVREDGALWLAKFPARDDTFDNARVEAACLQLARDAGIAVPETRLHDLPDGRTALLVRRFDREPTNGGHARLGFISALTVLEADELDRTRWSYVGLAQRLRRLPVPSSTFADVYRRMVFNMAIRNTDDHPRNHGFLLQPDNTLTLSPAYDLVPQPARPGVATEFSLAMSAGAQGRIATLENALSRCAHFGLHEDDAREICEHVGVAVQRWTQVFAGFGVDEQDRNRFEASFDQAAAMAAERSAPSPGPS